MCSLSQTLVAMHLLSSKNWVRSSSNQDICRLLNISIGATFDAVLDSIWRKSRRHATKLTHRVEKSLAATPQTCTGNGSHVKLLSGQGVCCQSICAKNPGKARRLTDALIANHRAPCTWTFEARHEPAQPVARLMQELASHPDVWKQRYRNGTCRKTHPFRLPCSKHGLNVEGFQRLAESAQPVRSPFHDCRGTRMAQAALCAQQAHNELQCLRQGSVCTLRSNPDPSEAILVTSDLRTSPLPVRKKSNIIIVYIFYDAHVCH